MASSYSTMNENDAFGSLSAIPIELICKILGLLPLKDLLRVQRLSTFWKRLVSNTPTLWQIVDIVHDDSSVPGKGDLTHEHIKTYIANSMGCIRTFDYVQIGRPYDQPTRWDVGLIDLVVVWMKENCKDLRHLGLHLREEHFEPQIVPPAWSMIFPNLESIDLHAPMKYADVNRIFTGCLNLRRAYIRDIKTYENEWWGTMRIPDQLEILWLSSGSTELTEDDHDNIYRAVSTYLISALIAYVYQFGEFTGGRRLRYFMPGACTFAQEPDFRSTQLETFVFRRWNAEHRLLLPETIESLDISIADVDHSVSLRSLGHMKTYVWPKLSLLQILVNWEYSNCHWDWIQQRCSSSLTSLTIHEYNGAISLEYVLSTPESLKMVSNLRSLEIYGYGSRQQSSLGALTDELLWQFANASPDLNRLGLTQCDSITPKGLVPFLSNPKQMEILYCKQLRSYVASTLRDMGHSVMFRGENGDS